jgi:hypothetical protein
MRNLLFGFAMSGSNPWMRGISERSNEIDDFELLLTSDLRKHRQRQDPAQVTMRVGKLQTHRARYSNKPALRERRLLTEVPQ